MTQQDAMNLLLTHNDPDVRAAAVVLKQSHDRRTRVMGLVQEALSQLRVDMKYLCFDLECTRKERDEARNTVPLEPKSLPLLKHALQVAHEQGSLSKTEYENLLREYT